MRVSNDGPLDGHENMERDGELLARAEGGMPGARVYQWTGPWISLGMSQSPARDLLNPDMVPWVMRPTGGKAVLHGHDQTIGLAVPCRALGVDPRSLKAAYRAIIPPIVAALNHCGLECALAEETKFSNTGVKTVDCFAHTSPNDVVDPRTGFKVCGCALRLTELAVLVQASVPNGPPLADPQLLFARPQLAIAPRWNPEGLSEALESFLREMLDQALPEKI